MGNVLDLMYRKSILEEINGEENKARKRESLKRFEIYKQRIAPFIIEKLKEEFSQSTVCEMRKLTSISLTKRIIHEEASIYKKEPIREFDETLSDNEVEQIENLYKESKANVMLKKANRFFKLFDQCAIQVVPKDGRIKLRVLAPHHYDVVPFEDDPERAKVFILSVFDKTDTITNQERLVNTDRPYADGSNQKIADADDWDMKNQRFIWWTEEWHFVTDGAGSILDVSDPNDLSQVMNPIQSLPFIDVATDKDFEFWVRNGSSVTDFDIDFGVLLSDTADGLRMQSHAQAIIHSEEPPQNLIIGPHTVLHMPLDPGKEVQPRFEFLSPNADFSKNLEFLENYISFFMSSRGQSTALISGKAEATASSGVQKLLEMIDRFEATRDDLDLFRWIEGEINKLMIKWSNAFQGVSDNPLIENLQLATLPEDVEMEVKFSRPEMIETLKEKGDRIIRDMEAGLMSRAEAISELREINDDKAQAVIEDIDRETMPQVRTLDA